MIGCMTGGSDKTGIIVPFGLPRPVALELIRELVRRGAFALEPKAKMNLRQRGFSMRQILATLEEGCINQGPKLDECNDWRCRLRKRHAGRIVHVVVAIHAMSYVYVISVH